MSLDNIGRAEEPSEVVVLNSIVGVRVPEDLRGLDLRLAMPTNLPDSE